MSARTTRSVRHRMRMRYGNPPGMRRTVADCIERNRKIAAAQAKIKRK